MSKSHEWLYYGGLAGGSLVVAMLLAWIGRDGLYYTSLVAEGILLFVGFVLLVISFLLSIALVVDLLRGRPLTEGIRGLISVLSMMLSLLLGFWGASWLLDRQITASKVWVEASIIEMEALYAEEGRYPREFDELPETLPPMPPYLREFGMYHSDNPGHWEIAVLDPRQGGLLESWVYSSRTRAWEVQETPPERFQ